MRIRLDVLRRIIREASSGNDLAKILRSMEMETLQLNGYKVIRLYYDGWCIDDEPYVDLDQAIELINRPARRR